MVACAHAINCTPPPQPRATRLTGTLALTTDVTVIVRSFTCVIVAGPISDDMKSFTGKIPSPVGSTIAAEKGNMYLYLANKNKTKTPPHTLSCTFIIQYSKITVHQ